MKVRTGIKWVAAIMLMVVLCFSVTVAVKGYGMYREAVDSMSLEDKVASIRAKENYTTFDQLPEIYVDAVLSVDLFSYFLCFYSCKKSFISPSKESISSAAILSVFSNARSICSELISFSCSCSMYPVNCSSDSPC